MDDVASVVVNAGEHEGQPVQTNTPEVEYLSLTAMSGTDAHEPDAQQRPFLAMFVQSVLDTSGTNPAVTSSSSTLDLENVLAAPIPGLYSLEQGTLIQSCRRLYIAGIDCAIEDADLGFVCIFVESQTLRTSTAISQQSPEEIIVACFIMAITLLQGARPHEAASVVPRLIKRVKDANAILSTQGSDMAQVRCLSLQAVLSLFDPTASSCWHLIGLAVTKAISMGLHRGTSTTTEQDVGKSGSSLFWTIYILDRTLAFTMDRPFSLEDSDITLDQPQMPGDLQQLSLDAAINALGNWIIPYMQMLSGWRRELGLDLNARFASYLYWRTMYTELADSLETKLTDEDPQHVIDLMAFVRKQESQLVCRALLQLVDIAYTKDPTNEAGHELRASATLEVPRFISRLEDYVQKHTSGLNFIDAYDVVGATLLLIHCQYSLPTSPRIAVSDLKLLITCIELLQTVAERFPPIKAFKEVLWKFLAALESGSDEELLAHAALCEVPVPGHFMRVMKSCLKARRGVTC